MASLKKLTHPNGRVVEVSDEQVSHYSTNGWVEQKPQTKEAPDVKPKPTRRSATPKKS